MARSARASSLDRTQAGDPRHHDDELVATVPARDVLGAHVLAAGLRQVGQNPVAHGVAVHVVDLLEVVQVSTGSPPW
jgi:hypothetical protein